MHWKISRSARRLSSHELLVENEPKRNDTRAFRQELGYHIAAIVRRSNPRHHAKGLRRLIRHFVTYAFANPTTTRAYNQQSYAAESDACRSPKHSILTSQSSLPLATAQSLSHAHVTGPACPVKVLSHLPVRGSQTFIMRSSLPLTSLR